jgi:hypothetical protein
MMVSLAVRISVNNDGLRRLRIDEIVLMLGRSASARLALGCSFIVWLVLGCSVGDEHVWERSTSAELVVLKEQRR